MTDRYSLFLFAFGGTVAHIFAWGFAALVFVAILLAIYLYAVDNG